MLPFWTWVHFKGGSKVLQNFEVWLLIKKGEVNILGWGWYTEGHYGKVKLIHFLWVRLPFYTSNFQRSTKYLTLELAQLLCFATDICRRWCRLNFEHSHGSQNFNHQTYYSSPYSNHIWQSSFHCYYIK